MRAGDDNPRPLESAALVAMSALLAIALAIWAIGGISGALFKGGWVGVRLDEAPAIAARLPDTLADPRRAWPAARRDELPGPPGFATANFLVGAGGAAR